MAKKKTNNEVQETEVVAPTTVKRGNKGGPVTVAKTPTELGELLGYDTPVLVSKKSILAAVQKQRSSDLAAELGL